MRIAVFIIHYGDKNITVSCAKSFANQNFKEFDIFLLDNGNTQNNQVFFCEKIGINIKYYSSKENLSYANALNFLYIKSKAFGLYDLYVLSNNDIKIIGNDFFDKLLSVYHEEKFNVFGPDVIKINGVHQSPMYLSYSLSLWYMIFSIFKTFISFMRTFVAEKKETLIENDSKYYRKNRLNCVLQGSILVVDKIYINRIFHSSYVVFPQNSLYMEEHILWYLCYLFNLKIYYCPRLQVYHIHESATRKKYNQLKIKQHNFYKNLLLSKYLYLKLLFNKRKILKQTKLS